MATIETSCSTAAIFETPLLPDLPAGCTVAPLPTAFFETIPSISTFLVLTSVGTWKPPLNVIVAAAVLYAIEFGTDKIPYLDNAWDAIHTLIRPTIGAVLGLLVAGDADTLGQAVD